MEEAGNFIDELLEEVEQKEKSLHLAHVDLVLGEIAKLEKKIVSNFEQTEIEKQILDDWTLRKNSKLQDKIDWMTKKLEAFIYEQGENVKTIDLPNGKLLRRKQPTKLEITDMDEFMTNSNLQQLGIVQPEILKPNLNMIKAYINSTKRIPKGVRVVHGAEKFSIKLNNNKEKNNGETKAGTRNKSSIQNSVNV